MTRILTLLILFLSFNTIAQKDSLLNSLGVYEKILEGKMPLSDTNLVIQLEDKVAQLTYIDPVKALDYSRKIYELSKILNYKRGIANGMRLTGDQMMLLDEVDSSQVVIRKAIEYCEKHKLSKVKTDCQYSLGSSYFYLSDYDKSLDAYFECYEYAKKFNPQAQAGGANGIGLVFRVIGNPEKAKEYFLEAYQLGKIYKDTSDQVQALNNLGIIAKNEDDYEQAFAYYNEGLELAELSNNLRKAGEFYYNLAIMYERTGEIEKGFEFMEKSAEVTKKTSSKRGVAMDYFSLGLFYFNRNRFDKAIVNLELALSYSEEVKYDELIVASYKGLAMAFNGAGNYQQAYNCMTRAYVYNDSLGLAYANAQALELENQTLLAEVAERDSLDKIRVEQQRSYEKNLSAEKVKSRELLLWSSGAVIILVIIALYFMFRSRSQLKIKNVIITDRNNQIEIQKEELIEQHKEIRDSITYAKRIQNALLSGNEEWDKISMKHFILFKPKDVVSGDFYWAHHFDKENISIWVTADCTGHGVPGAFMSMLGIGFLNEIVIENGTKSGSEILNLLRAKIIKALAQKSGGQQQKDGMDLALCIWDRKSNQLEFTGANNPLWILRKRAQIETENHEKTHFHEGNEYGIIELAANKMPVGFHTETAASFKSQTFQLREDDRIISFTDGYADQFGGAKGKKLKYKPFKNMLIEIQSKPVQLQGELLTDLFDKWIGDFEQIDDVCLIGVKV